MKFRELLEALPKHNAFAWFRDDRTRILYKVNVNGDIINNDTNKKQDLSSFHLLYKKDDVVNKYGDVSKESIREFISTKIVKAGLHNWNNKKFVKALNDSFANVTFIDIKDRK